MRNKRKSLLIGVIVLQLLFLSGLAGSYYAVGWFGEEIRLETAPIDPRDLFHGDYVTLNYEISSLPRSYWRGGQEPEYGQRVYVVLRQGAVYHEAISAHPAKPELQEGEVLLQGRVDYSWGDTIRIRYGFERYYVPEGTGRELEDNYPRLTVLVKVAPWGQSAISGVELR